MKAAGNIAALLEHMVAHVLTPLVVGGTIAPAGPFDFPTAKAIARNAAVVSAAELSWVSVARVRRARELCPVDVLPMPDENEWLMLTVFNDLLHVSDPQINRVLAPRRAQRLLEQIQWRLGEVAEVQTVAQAVARHSTFAQLLSTQRTDKEVHWWCGSAEFVGREPPNRLTWWPGLRRVRTDEKSVSLAHMAAGDDAFRARYLQVLARLLACSPLTDLATAHRDAPVFTWSAGSLSLVSTSPGRILALRAIRQAGARAITAIRSATKESTVQRMPELAPALQLVLNELKSH